MPTRDTEVLVVDDEEPLRRLLGRAFGNAGFKVETAGSGEQALTIMRQGRRFDTIVSDLMMPGMDGMQLLREIRQIDLDVPLIFLTGNPSLATAMEAMELGGYRYLAKPIEHERLIVAVQEAAAHHRLAMLKRKALEVCEAGGWLIEELDDLSGRFQHALDKLWVAYQPIVSWSGQSVFGYEALVRSADPDLSTPGKLLDAAERLGRVQDLGERVRDAVGSAASAAPAGALLFVNLHALDLTAEHLYSLHCPLARHAEHVVLEVTERAALHRVDHLQHRIGRLKDMGYRIAVDDLGASHAGLSSFRQIEPDMVKLDISLVRDIDGSAAKAKLVKNMIGLCSQDLGMRVVCEGVETEPERDTLLGIGADLLQGYLMGMPSRSFQPSMAITSRAS
jgi:EAL domain-containing protein (putative c-di-GMP-specific phosphodiesterase class I)/CheY-like chemotaxis protein